MQRCCLKLFSSIEKTITLPSTDILASILSSSVPFVVQREENNTGFSPDNGARRASERQGRDNIDTEDKQKLWRRHALSGR